jgi:two-component sensor histidine kinase
MVADMPMALTHANSRVFRSLRIGGILLPLLAAALFSFWAYGEQREAADARGRENVALIRQYVLRLVETQSLLHDAARARAEGEDADFLQSKAFHTFLARAAQSNAATISVAVISTSGRFLVSSELFPTDFSVGPRDYLDAIANGETLFLDRVVLAPDGQDALIVATPFRTDTTDGAIVSALNIGSITGFLGDIASHEGESASLIREDGLILARHRVAPPLMLEPDTPAVVNMARSPSGNYPARAISDGTFRYYAYGRVGNLPIVAHFGVPRRAVVTAALWDSLRASALLLAIGVVTYLIALQAERTVRVNLVAAEQRKRRLEAERLATQRANLLREINHRVKNNLAVIAGLVRMQMRASGTTTLRGEDVLARILAIGSIHEVMYSADDSALVDVGEVIQQICSSDAIVPPESGIATDMDIAPGLLLDPQHTTPLALLTAELLTNAVKHAFAGRPTGTIRVALRRDGQRGVLEVADDGVGLPAHPSARRSGLELVDAFVQQLGGTLEHGNRGGAWFRISFPLAA